MTPLSPSAPPSPLRRLRQTLPRVGRVLARSDATLRRRRGFLLAVALLNVAVLAVGIAPFVLWHGFGPPTFADLAPGRVQPRAVLPSEAATPSVAVDDEVVAAPPPNDRAAPDIATTLAPSVRVTLVFSVGSRGMTSADAQRLRVNDLEARGADGLTDTMLVVLADTATHRVAMLSIPRDLWLFERGHRINASFNRHGTQAFVEDVAHVLGLPIDHVVRLNFTAFADLVDRVGGVALPADRPLADLNSVLFVPQAGCWRFDGAAALAFVRSRHTLTPDVTGRWRADASASDQGRIARQRALLGAIWEQVRGTALVRNVGDLLAVARDGLVVDQSLGVQALRELLDAFGELSAGRVEAYTLPTIPQRIGSAAAEILDQDAARPMIARLRAWPPATTDAMEAPADAPTIAVDASCAGAAARELPDPREALAAIAAGQPVRWQPAESPTDQASEPTASEADPTEPASGTPSPSPSDAASQSPSEPTSETPSEPIQLPTGGAGSSDDGSGAP